MTQTLRRIPTLLCAALLLTGALCAGLLAAEEPPPKRPTAVQIVRAAKDLGSHDRAKRIAAEALLKRAGPAALSALTEAAQHPNRLVAARAKRIVERTITGITGDTPADVAALAKSYAAATLEARLRILPKLASHGEHGLRIIRAIVMVNEDPNATATVAKDYFPRVQKLIRAGKFTEAEAWLWLALSDSKRNDFRDTNGAIADMAAFLAMRGRHKQVTDEVLGWNAFQESGPRTELLISLYRTQGRYGDAAQAAESIGALYRTFEMMAHDDNCAAAAALSIARARNGSDHPVQLLWKHAVACAYAAGDEKLLDTALAGLRGSVGDDAPDERQQKARDNLMSTWLAIAGRGGDIVAPHINRKSPRLAINALLQQGQATGIRELDDAVKTSISQGRFENLSERARRFGAKLGAQLEMAHFHLERGADKDVRTCLQAAFDMANARPDSPGMLAVVARQERSAGIPDLASEHLLLALSRATSNYHLRKVMESVFHGRAQEAYAWWRFLRKTQPDAAPADALARLDHIIDGTLPAKEFAALAAAFDKTLSKLIEEEIPADPVPNGNDEIQAKLKRLQEELRRRSVPDGNARMLPADRIEDRYLTALAHTSVRYQAIDLALKCTLKTRGQAAEPSASKLRTAVDILLGAGRWAEATRICEQLEEMTEHPVVTDVFKHGMAKLHAGQEAEGRRLIEIAHLLSLGRAPLRSRAARELDWLGFFEEAARERALFLQVADWGSFYGYAYVDLRATVDFTLHRMVDAGQWTEYRKLAGHAFSIAVLANFFRNPRMLVLYRGRIQVGRAGELLTAGKKAEAVKLAHEVIDETPCWASLVIPLVKLFDNAGMKAEADRIFKKSNAAFRATSKVLPGDWGIFNDWAWMASECGRDLDTALANAQRSAHMAQNSDFWGTLAAVHIARKEYKQAYIIQLTDKERHPDNCWQMGRIRAALRKEQR
jgi:HPt (histidine-containing phosphotransfer) domain-containing protein